MDFKPIYAALADRLRADLGSKVALVTRKNLPASSFENQPALVVLADSAEVEGGLRVPVTWELGAALFLHTREAGDDQAPDEQILDLIAAIAGALSWRQGEQRSEGVGAWTTLGGKVLWAVLDGAIVEDQETDAAQKTTTLRVRMRARG